MSAVLLRRFISKTADGLFDRLDAQTGNEVKARLLSRLAETQSSGPIQKGIAHCIAALGCQLLESWPELLPALFAVVRSGAVSAQCAALLVFASLAPHFSDAMLAAQAKDLRDACGYALQQPAVEVKVGALEATLELVTYLKDAKQIAAFQQLLPTLVAAVGQTLQEANWAAAERSVQAFIGLAEVAPEFFSAHLKEVFAPFLEIAGAQALDANLRQLAFEFTITLAETDPKGVRRLPQYLPVSVPLAMQLQLALEHSKDWASSPPEDDDDSPEFDFGVEALDRLAVALGGRRMHPVVSPLIMQFLQSEDWRHRHAGLWSLSQVAEGCAKEFKPLLAQIVPLIVRGLEDQHERVRYAAVTCLAQFCTEFAPEWQAQHHTVFLPLLGQRLRDVPRVAALAAQACINFLAGAEQEDTEPHLDGLLMAMLQLLQSSPHRFVSEAVVSAITAIAAHTQRLFAKYYDTIMPWLKSVITAPVVARPDRMLRAKALECLARVALAVGKARFLGDAPEVLAAMQRMQASNPEADDPVTAYLMRAWGNVAECLGRDMGQYYAAVMPTILMQLQAKTDVVISDEEGQEAEEGVQSLTLALKGLGDKRISIKTAALEEKALAVAVLAQLLEAGADAMFPFAEALLPALLPLLRFVYMEDVREDAASCMPALLKCVKLHSGATPAMVRQVAQHVCAGLVEAAQREPESTVRAAQLQALSQCIDEAPAGCLGAAFASEAAAVAQKALADGGAARERLRTEKRGCDDEDDAERLDADIEAEEEAMCQALDVTTSLLKQEATFLPLWESTFFPQYTRLLNRGLFETRLALCALASFLEHHGTGACAPHVGSIAAALLEQCRPDHDDPDVVQTACYGLGVGCAQGALAAGFAPAAIERLLAVVQRRAGDADWESAVCNAAAALLKAHEGQGGQGAAAGPAVLPTVLAALPLKGDEDEARAAHRRVVQLLATNDPVVAAQRAAVQRLAPLRGTAFLDEETGVQLSALGC